MHMNSTDERISPVSWAHRNHGIHRYSDGETRHYWRRTSKRNGGRKTKTLRSHRKGR